MSMPPPVMYTDVASLRNWVSGTDSGVGTPAQLSTSQLTQAIVAATNRISIFMGNVFDSSTDAAVPPSAFNDLCLDIAAFYAWRTYLKGKGLPPTHPAVIAYNAAITLLNDVRDGKVRLDPVTVGGIGDEIGVVINRIPPVFTMGDSNTRISPLTGYLTADVPIGSPDWAPIGDDWGGTVYQG